MTSKLTASSGEIYENNVDYRVISFKTRTFTRSEIWDMESDSRKRPLDGECESGVTKKSNQGGDDGTDMGTSSWDDSSMRHSGDAPRADMVHLKVLVPSVAAGAIIGKGGETIAQVQKDAGAKVKMSKSNDFYPGTNERVCLITGSMEAIIQVHNFMMERIREKPDPNPKSEIDGKVNLERHKQVKILVPNSTAGMIIGKCGVFIRRIKEQSGAYVQISQKSKDLNLSERCITVAGEPDQTRQATQMILEKIAEDPQSGSCLNISYSEVTGPVASSNPTGSPFASGPGQGMGSGPASAGMMGGGPFRGTGTGVIGGGLQNSGGGNGSLSGANIRGQMNNLNISNQQNMHHHQQQSQQHQQHHHQRLPNMATENIKSTLRGSGYSELATEEITSALATLANYGFFNLGMNQGGGLLGSLMANLLGNIASLGASASTGMGGSGSGTNLSNSGTNLLAGSNSGTSLGGGGMNTNSGNSGSLFGPVGSNPSGMGEPSQMSALFGGTSSSGDMFGDFSFGRTGFVGDREPMNKNSFGLGMDMDDKLLDEPDVDELTRKEIEVSENLVGVILGLGGRGILEIQHQTGANIQISKKGVFKPGTQNRVVTVTGTGPCVTRAYMYITQRLSEEENRRARQNTKR